LVLRPYDELFGNAEKTSTLMVNHPLRKEFERLHAETDEAKASFLNGFLPFKLDHLIPVAAARFPTPGRCK
jgi:hypothetical protein